MQSPVQTRAGGSASKGSVSYGNGRIDRGKRMWSCGLISAAMIAVPFAITDEFLPDLLASCGCGYAFTRTRRRFSVILCPSESGLPEAQPLCDMQQRSSKKRSTHQLKRIIEEIVEDECKLSPRGLLFLMDELEVSGHPPARINVWGTLHFLPLGSPFCCLEPGCHLGLYTGRQERICDGVRRRLRLTQPVAIEFSGIGSMVPNGVTSDRGYRPSAPDLAYDAT